MSCTSETQINCTSAPVSTSETVLLATLSIACRQLGSKQDHIIQSHNNIDPVTGKLFSMIEIYDGHGENDCIECLRTNNTTEIIVNCPFAPELALEMMLKQKKPYMLYQSGSTFSCIKIFDTWIDCRSTGDSEIWCFINGKCIYKSPNHIWSNLEEQSRISHLVEPIVSYKPELMSANLITMAKSSCVRWKACPIPLQLVPTQSLGHCNITGLCPAVKRINFNLEDDVRVIIGSDGLWDMIRPFEDNEILCMCTDADELCRFAEARWKQEWDFIEDMKFPDKIEQTVFDAFDDISVGIYNKPVNCNALIE